MSWINFFTISTIATGGFIAATYEVIAKRIGLPVGFYFRENGVMSILGGIVTFVSLILSAIFNPWWSLLIVFVVGWFLSQVVVKFFKSLSQIISLLLIVSGTVLFLFFLLNG